MENLKIGDVLICRRKSWISKSIMFFTRGEWSHSAIVAETWGQVGVIEAQKNGVNFKVFNVWENKWGYEYKILRYNEPFNEKELMIKAFSKCGETKYDFFTFFRRAFGKRKERSEVIENRKMICSEFVAYVWSLPGGYQITPDELYNYLLNNKSWVEI